MSLLAGLTTDDLVEGSVNQYFTPERARMAAAAMFATLAPLDDNPKSNVEFTYDAVRGCITANVELETPGILSLKEDPAPALSANLNINDHDIIGVGDVNIAGELIADALIINNLILAEKGVVRITNNGSLFVDQITVADGITSNDMLINNMLTANNLSVYGEATVDADLKVFGNLYPENVKTNTVTAFALTGTLLGTDARDLTTPTDAEVLVGTSKLPATLKLHSSGAHAVFTGLTDTQSVNDDANTAFFFRQSRGTLEAPTQIKSGDIITRFNAQGYDGKNFQTLVSFGARADVSQEALGGEFVIGTFDSDNQVHHATFNSAGVLSAPVIQTGTTYPENPAKGMIIFDDDTGKFVGYNGTTWVTLSN